MFIAFSSCYDDSQNQDHAPICIERDTFNFEHFGRAHIAYLHYINNTPKELTIAERFIYGKTFIDSVFGSFDKSPPWTVPEKRPENGPAFHLNRAEQILKGIYHAESEGLSPNMEWFLTQLSSGIRKAVLYGYNTETLFARVDHLKGIILTNHHVVLDNETGRSNDFATMMAMCSILKNSLTYWNTVEQHNTLAKNHENWKRAIAGTWGYLSSWTSNDEGVYSWDHTSALINASRVSDRICN